MGKAQGGHWGGRDAGAHPAWGEAGRWGDQGGAPAPVFYHLMGNCQGRSSHINLPRVFSHRKLWERQNLIPNQGYWSPSLESIKFQVWFPEEENIFPSIFKSTPHQTIGVSQIPEHRSLLCFFPPSLSRASLSSLAGASGPECRLGCRLRCPAPLLHHLFCSNPFPNLATQMKK